MTHPRWETLADGLAKQLEGQEVTHAVFTTYAFEPEFFESSIFPLLLAEKAEGLSLHSAIRRLQLEQILRDAPIPTDVYFDATVAVPGVPWLPYSLHPVRLQGEFHGKIILLRLREEKSSKIRWLLGAGSANLTKAGWWENIEVWHFAPLFDPGSIPHGIEPGLRSLLNFLSKSQARFNNAARQVSAVQFMTKEIAKASTRRRLTGEAKFGVFLPGGERFPTWIHSQSPAHNETTAEVVSPYFADNDHARLIDETQSALGTSQLQVWLPHDPWEAGNAVLMREDQYHGIEKGATWCQFSEATLAAKRKPSEVPRFLHAKVFRVPGVFSFIGSVNFSFKAFYQNYEAGFLVKDTTPSWLEPTTLRPGQFIAPPDAALQREEATSLGIIGLFDWKTCSLTIQFSKAALKQYAGQRVAILDSNGQKATGATIPEEGNLDFSFKCQEPLCEALRHCTWITLSFPDASSLVWVQQIGLEYRPPPAELRPDAWRILDFWRSLIGGKPGSHPDVFHNLEFQLTKDGDRGEEILAGSLSKDVFTSMAVAHGSFHALREALARLKREENLPRRLYYFAADRPDTLHSLISRLQEYSIAADATTNSEIDPVDAWTMLNWVRQLCLEHADLPEAKKILRQAKHVMDTLESRDPLASVEKEWLAWTAAMFICKPGKESLTTKRLLNKTIQ
ncbi:phospholipase D-like domain-containing protein [Noviherbaspirillum massiliense]|uniref:phospholipase D-like domain-containing protein n=1 Tax=Noviherbaspirillum massiliense TaxID=1465823 RepID=UPI0002F00BC0|nr:phospholipase D-like domain-containing protein [Noviherbaspirillum massiliense]